MVAVPGKTPVTKQLVVEVDGVILAMPELLVLHVPPATGSKYVVDAPAQMVVGSPVMGRSVSIVTVK
jgi:hypothetical protein